MYSIGLKAKKNLMLNLISLCCSYFNPVSSKLETTHWPSCVIFKRKISFLIFFSKIIIFQIKPSSARLQFPFKKCHKTLRAALRCTTNGYLNCSLEKQLIGETRERSLSFSAQHKLPKHELGHKSILWGVNKIPHYATADTASPTNGTLECNARKCRFRRI